MTRDQLHEVYMDWLNNFVSVEGYAEHYGLHVDEANTLIALARRVTYTEHPEA